MERVPPDGGREQEADEDAARRVQAAAEREAVLARRAVDVAVEAEGAVSGCVFV